MRATELQKQSQGALTVILFLVALALALFPGPGRAAKIPVAATIVPLGDFCRHLGGDLVEVQVLVPPGASPHVFEPPPSVMAGAFRARVFVYIGAGLEPWAAKIVASRESGKVAVVEAAQGIPLIKEVGGHGAGPPGGRPKGHEPDDGVEKAPGAHEGHHHEAGNPHIWLDPVLAQDICGRIAAAFIQVDPEHRALYEARRQQFMTALAALDQEIRQQVETWHLREFISFHPAFSYFARRYGLKEVGVLELAPGREATPRHLQEIVAAIRQYGLRVVFAEPQLNPRVAQVVAQEAGVKLLMLDPIGGRPPYGDDYLKLMRANLATMGEAMK
jgi:zinc transport system substrate-binding protein